MDVVTGVELECSYGAGDGRTRSGVASMPKERSGGPRLDWSCDWEKYGYDTDKNFGPFEIITKPGSLSFMLRLPDTMKSVHPVFHVSQLETSLQSSIPNRVQSLPPPIEVDGEVEYEVEEILDSKIDRRRRHCQLLYLVRWAGYASTDEETSWLLATELDHASELVEDFHHKYPGKPGPHKSA